MTRKHFNALADALKAVSTAMNNETHALLVERIADVCAQSNGEFKRQKFRDACGVNLTCAAQARKADR